MEGTDKKQINIHGIEKNNSTYEGKDCYFIVSGQRKAFHGEDDLEVRPGGHEQESHTAL